MTRSSGEIASCVILVIMAVVLMAACLVLIFQKHETGIGSHNVVNDHVEDSRFLYRKGLMEWKSKKGMTNDVNGVVALDSSAMWSSDLSFKGKVTVGVLGACAVVNIIGAITLMLITGKSGANSKLHPKIEKVGVVTAVRTTGTTETVIKV